MDKDHIVCAYCGNSYTEWDHFHPLNTYNDERKKTLFFVAVNLLELDDLENTISELDENTSNLTLKEKSAYAASLLQEAAKKENIILKLHKQKKPGKSR